MEKPTKPVEVTATVGFDAHGARRYRTIIYQVEHWEEAMSLLFATVSWQKLRDEYQGQPKIYGITFSFKNNSHGKATHPR